MKSAVPDESQQAAKDAASAAKDSLPVAPKDIPNPLQNFFSGKHDHVCRLRSIQSPVRAKAHVALSQVLVDQVRAQPGSTRIARKLSDRVHPVQVTASPRRLHRMPHLQ